MVKKSEIWISGSLLACALLLVFSGPRRGAAQTYTFTADSQLTTASNAPVPSAPTPIYSASSIQNAYYPQLAFDGNLGTRWSSLFSDPQWLGVDYGTAKTFDRVTLNWEAAYAKAYKIQTSNDGAVWTDVYVATGGKGGQEIMTFQPVTARFVRLYGSQRATVWGYSLYEMAVDLVDLPMTATASSQESAALPPSNAVDGNLNTRWGSLFSDPQWLAVDMRVAKTINQVTLDWENAYAKSYKIQVSNDGVTWTDVYATTNGQGGAELVTFPAVTARFVRLYATQRATSWGYSLYEMKPGSPSGPVADVTPPVTKILAPANGATLSSLAKISGTAADDLSGMAKVALQIQDRTGGKWFDGAAFAASSPQDILTNWLTPANTAWMYAGAVPYQPGGSYSILAKGTDLAGNVMGPAQFILGQSSVGFALAGAPTPPPPTLPTGPSLTLAPGREFASNSFVHQALADNAPIDPNSAALVGNLISQIQKYYGVAAVNINQYTPAIFVVPSTQPTVAVKAWDRTTGATFSTLQQKWTAVPLPDNFVAASGTDQEAVVYQPSTGKVWEFWLMQKTGATTVNSAGQSVAEWGARWGGRMDNISTNPGYFLTEGGDWNTTTGAKYGTTATSIAFMSGILTIQEQQKGVIDHVVGVALPEVLYYPHWSYPANRCDGQVNAANAIPEGTLFRLPASLNLDALDMDPYARMIAKAVQKHGMVVWDRAGTVSFRAENPANQYPNGNPYTQAGGILNCPGGVSQQACWADSNGRLRGFPWSQLQVLQLRMNQ